MAIPFLRGKGMAEGMAEVMAEICIPTVSQLDYS